MQAFRVETIVGAAGKLSIEGLPFNAGERVEVIVLSVGSQPELRAASAPALLAGSVLAYEEPFGPAVEPSEWEAMGLVGVAIIAVDPDFAAGARR